MRADWQAQQSQFALRQVDEQAMESLSIVAKKSRWDRAVTSCAADSRPPPLLEIGAGRLRSAGQHFVST
jgi:hypothetical protein